MSLTCSGITQNEPPEWATEGIFLKALAAAWQSVNQPVDMQEASYSLSQLSNQECFDIANIWVFDKKADTFTRVWR